MRKPTAKQQAKLNEKRVEQAYYRTCSGVQIMMMDIGKVFAHGKELVSQGLDDAALGTGIRAFVDTIRVG